MDEKVRHYETLNSELMRIQVDSMRMNIAQRAGNPNSTTPTSTEYLTLSNKVNEARAPIADILARRNQVAAESYRKFSVEQLIADYAKDRFDLVIDSSDMIHASPFRAPIVYQKSGEVLDITDAVIKSVSEKIK